MKKIILTAAVFGVLGAAAERPHGKLVLRASIPDLPNDSVVYLYGFNGQELDSTYVKDHSFSFDREVKGDVYAVMVGKARNERHGMAIYLDAGNVTITGKGPYFDDAKVEGPSWIAEWKEMNQLMMDPGQFPGAAELPQQMTEARKVGDRDKYQELLALDNEYSRKKYAIGCKWVMEHPASPVSACAVLFYLAPRLSLDSLSVWYNRLTPEARANALGDAVEVRLKGPAIASIGKAAKAFSLPDGEGKMVSLSDFRGKYVLVDFWASWCKPCRAENPKIKAVYDRFHDRNFTVVGISLDTEKEKWKKAIEQDGLVWTQVSDLKGWSSSAATDYGVQGIPASFLVGPDGTIIASGGDKEKLIQLLEEKLGPSSK